MADWSIQVLNNIFPSIEQCGYLLEYLAAGREVAVYYLFRVCEGGVEPRIGQVASAQHLLGKICLALQRLVILKIEVA